jgi:hypothetical protein
MRAAARVCGSTADHSKERMAALPRRSHIRGQTAHLHNVKGVCDCGAQDRGGAAGHHRLPCCQLLAIAIVLACTPEASGNHTHSRTPRQHPCWSRHQSAHFGLLMGVPEVLVLACCTAARENQGSSLRDEGGAHSTARRPCGSWPRTGTSGWCRCAALWARRRTTGPAAPPPAQLSPRS